MVAVASSEVAAYEHLIDKLARKYQGFAGAEYDDLAQEGRIAVWQSIGRRTTPSLLVIEGRMIDWVRFIRRLVHNDAVAYERLLPIEDYNFEG